MLSFGTLSLVGVPYAHDPKRMVFTGLTPITMQFFISGISSSVIGRMDFFIGRFISPCLT